MKVADFISSVSLVPCGGELWKAGACLTKTFLFFRSLSLYMRLIIRSSFEASLKVTWPLNAYTVFIKVPLCKGQRNRRVTREREKMKGHEGWERPSEREMQSLLAAMLKVCRSYSAEWKVPQIFLKTPPFCLCFPCAPSLSEGWFQVTDWLRVKEDCTLGNSAQHTRLLSLYLPLRRSVTHTHTEHAHSLGFQLQASLTALQLPLY